MNQIVCADAKCTCFAHSMFHLAVITADIALSWVFDSRACHVRLAGHSLSIDYIYIAFVFFFLSYYNYIIHRFLLGTYNTWMEDAIRSISHYSQYYGSLLAKFRPPIIAVWCCMATLLGSGDRGFNPLSGCCILFMACTFNIQPFENIIIVIAWLTRLFLVIFSVLRFL